MRPQFLSTPSAVVSGREAQQQAAKSLLKKPQLVQTP